jgi:hypothetical protein
MRQAINAKPFTGIIKDDVPFESGFPFYGLTHVIR